MDTVPQAQLAVFSRLRHKTFARAILSFVLLVTLITAAFPACHFLKNVQWMEICSGLGAKMVVAVEAGDSDQTNHTDPADHKIVQTVCPHCTHLSSLAMLPSDKDAFAPTLHAISSSFELHDAFFARDLWSSVQQSRAPPTLS